MRLQRKRWALAFSAVLASSLVLFGCSIGGSSSSGTTTSHGTPAATTTGGTTTGGTTGGAGGTTTGGGTTTSGGGTITGGSGATPAPAAVAPPRALAWFQMDGSNVGQIWASVNGDVAHQVTHMPSSSADCRRNEHWSPPVFSPNLANIVAAWGSADCTDGPETGPLYVIDATSGAATQVPGTVALRLSLRTAGWVNNTTVWWIDYNGVHTYVLGGAATLLSSLGGANPNDATLRGNTLFYSTGSTSYTLNRFDMTSHAVLAGSVNLGTTNPCVCSRNDALSPGFDASADGAHIVFQRVAPAGSGGDQEGVGSSQFFYANADGSGATRIASYATSNSMTRIQISPNGHLIAVARAEAAPSVFTASVTSAGNSGDPDLHFYTPDGRSYAVWKWDNSTFWASTSDLDNVYPPTTGNMEHFDLGVGAGSVGAAGGADPWYTIGS